MMQDSIGNIRSQSLTNTTQKYEKRCIISKIY